MPFPDTKSYRGVAIRPESGTFTYADAAGKQFSLSGTAADLAVRNYVRETGGKGVDRQTLANWSAYAKSLGAKAPQTPLATPKPTAPQQQQQQQPFKLGPAQDSVRVAQARYDAAVQQKDPAVVQKAAAALQAAKKTPQKPKPKLG